MVRERLGNVFLHSCGHVWSARGNDPKRCPGCDVRLKKGEAVKLKKKYLRDLYKTLTEVV